MAAILKHVVGQNWALTRIREAVVKQRVPSTWLFVGPSGVGKRLAALGLAQLLVCEKRQGEVQEACGQCPSCIRVEKKNSENLFCLEPDGLQIKMEQAQELLRYIALAAVGRPRVVIINEAHTLNPQAANALLKSLEEPPALTHFVLITPSTAGILPTIRSRSQVLRFSPLSMTELGQVVNAPEWVLRSAQGRVDVAMQWLDPDSGETRQKALRSLSQVVAGQKALALEELADVFRQRETSLSVVRLWLQVFRDAALRASGGGQAIHADQPELFANLSSQPLTRLLDWGQNCLRLESDIVANVERSLCFENFVNRLSHELEA